MTGDVPPEFVEAHRMALRAVKGNIARVDENLDLIAKNVLLIKEHRWRLFRNFRLIRQSRFLLEDNRQLIEANESLCIIAGAALEDGEGQS